MTITPPGASPSPFSSVRPRRMAGPTATCATSSTRTGVPSRTVIGLLHVSAPADDVLVAGDLEDATADALVRRPDRSHDVVHGDAVREQLVRIDVDLVLLHEAADTGHLGDARHALQRVTHVPVLER